MKVAGHPRELFSLGRKTCLAIGFFDGVHRGHQAIINQTLADARREGAVSVVVTFDQHPSRVLAPNRVPRLIYTNSQRLRAIKDLGVDGLLLLPFNLRLSQQTADEFVRGLCREFRGLASICVGRNFVFGHNRHGNLALLRELGGELGFSAHGVEPVLFEGVTISSTRIRKAIAEGDLSAVTSMLGRCWTLAGEVVRGDGLGRQIGVPTANLRCIGMALPPAGVYAATASLDGTSYRAVVNVGHRPTLAKAHAEIRVEAHLLDFGADVYGRELEIAFERRLRGEVAFPSITELKEQILRDIAAAREPHIAS